MKFGFPAVRPCLHALTAALLLTACQANPITGREQLQLVSQQQVLSLSEQSYLSLVSEARARNQVDTVSPRHQRVDRIVQRLIPQAVALRPDAGSWAWQVTVIQDATINASCLPGGRIVVYTGLIDSLQLSDDEIAVVLGHEISHALLDHGAEKMSNGVLGQAIVAGIAAANNSTATPELAQMGVQLFMLLPNSRTAELEADRLGMRIAARADFDPGATITLFGKFKQLQQGSQPEFLSTHPVDDTRIAQAQAYLPEMEAERPARRR
ncbi:MAG: M48 family metallopeptidase [Pseudomonadota bacterium]|nr:M48 family metallopeptidase [Pseudomonadota bacterium]